MRVLQAPSGIDIKVYTRLMENHHVVNSNLRMPRGVAESIYAFSGDDGSDIIFLSMGGQISCFYFGGGVQSSYASTILPLQGRHMVAATGADGCTHVFAHGTSDVCYCRETAPHSGRFGEELDLDLPLPRNLKSVERLLVRKLDIGFAVAAVSSTLDSDAYYLSYAFFGQECAPQILEIPFRSAHLGLLGHSFDDLAVTGLGEGYVVCRLRDRHVESYELRSAYQEVTWRESHAAGDHLFALCACDEGTFPAVVIPEPSGEAVLCALAQPGDYDRFCAGFGMGRYHVLMQGAQLSHLDGTPVAGGFDAISPAPIEQRCDAFALCGGPAALAAYYCVDGALIRLEYNKDTTAWKESKLADVTGAPVSALPCYSTDISFTDEHMKPCAGAQVQVWTESRTFLETSSGTVCTDADHRATLTTDAQGKVRIVQHVDNVNSNPLMVSAAGGLLSANEVLTVNQYEHQQQRFSALTADEVMNAQRSTRADQAGSYRDEPLLDDEHRTRANAEAIAKSVAKLMKAANPVNNDPYRFGTWLCRRDELGSVGRLAPCDNLPAWRLVVEGPSMRFAPLTKQQAFQGMQSLYYDENGVALPKWLTSIGNFFRSLAKKIASVVEMIIEGLKAVVQVVLNGVKMVFEAVLGFVSQILDMVITIFIAVAVVFLALFCWLIFHSKWDDILRCKRAYRSIALHYLDVYPAACSSVQSFLDGFLVEAQANVREASRMFEDVVGADTAPLGYINENRRVDPAVEESQSNNLMLASFTENVRGAVLQMPESPPDGPDATIVELIDSLTASISQSAAGGKAFDFASKRAKSYDDLLTVAFSETDEVFPDVAELVLDATRQVCDAALGQVSSTCSAMKASITAPLSIPVLSDIYEFIAGDEMTVLDMACLIAAIPTTLLTKAVKGSWPLSNDDEVDRFVRAVAALPLGPGDCRADAIDGPLEKDWQELLAAAGTTFGVTFMVLTLTQNAQDIRPAQGEHDAPSNDSESVTLGWSMVVLETLWAAAACPEAFRKPDEPVTVAGWALYAYPFLGSLLDGSMVAYLGEYPDHHRSDVGRWWTLGYGLGHLVVYIFYCIYFDPKNPGQKCPPWYDLAANLSCILMELSKIALHSKIAHPAIRAIPTVLDGVGIIGALCNLCGPLSLSNQTSQEEGAVL